MVIVSVRKGTPFFWKIKSFSEFFFVAPLFTGASPAFWGDLFKKKEKILRTHLSKMLASPPCGSVYSVYSVCFVYFRLRVPNL